jgi:DNA-binding XRE family transcriptional regulator
MENTDDLKEIMNSAKKLRTAREDIKRKYLILFGDNVKSKRESLNLSQEDLGFMVGLQRTSIISIEKGNQDTPMSILILLSCALECNPTELIPQFDI